MRGLDSLASVPDISNDREAISETDDMKSLLKQTQQDTLSKSVLDGYGHVPDFRAWPILPIRSDTHHSAMKINMTSRLAISKTPDNTGYGLLLAKPTKSALQLSRQDVLSGLVLEGYGHVTGVDEVMSRRGWQSKPLTEQGNDEKLKIYSAAIKSAAQVGDYALAEKYLAEIFRVGLRPDIRLYNEVIRSCSEAGNYFCAEQWLTKAIWSGIAPDADSYDCVIKAYFKAGDYKLAERSLNNYTQLGLRQSIERYNIVIGAYAKAGKHLLAAKLVADAVLAGLTPDAFSYSFVVEACANAGDLTGAEIWSMEAAQAGFNNIRASAKAGQDASSQRILEEAIQAGIKQHDIHWWLKRALHPTDIGVYNMMMSTFAKAGKHVLAEKVFNEAIKEGAEPNLSSYWYLIRACVNAREPISAEKWLADAVQSGHNQNIITYNMVIHSYAKAGKHNLAEELLADAMQTGIKPDLHSYVYLSKACVNAGEPALAETWLTKAVQEGLGTPNWTPVIDAYLAAGEHALAERCLKKAIQAGFKLDQMWTWRSGRVIISCAKAGNFNLAEKWLSRAVKAEVNFDLIFYNALIAASADAGKYALAEKCLANAVQAGLRPNIKSYTGLILAYRSSKLQLRDRRVKAKKVLADMLKAKIKPDLDFRSGFSFYAEKQFFEHTWAQLQAS